MCVDVKGKDNIIQGNPTIHLRSVMKQIEKEEIRDYIIPKMGKELVRPHSYNLGSWMHLWIKESRRKTVRVL